MLSDSCPVLSVLSVCDVGALWPNGWTDQDETWHAGRPRHWPHCIRWYPAPPPPKGHSPPFSAHICCSQMAAWTQMPLGMELGLGPGDFVLHGDAAPPSPNEMRSPPIFDPCPLLPYGWMNYDATWYGGRPRPRRLCVTWGPGSPKSGTAPNFRSMSIVAKRLDASEYHLVRQATVLDGDLALPKRDTAPRNFRPMSVVAKRLDELRCHLVWRQASAQATLC